MERSSPARELAASPPKVSRAHPLPPATHANTARVARVRKKCDCFAVNSRPEQNRHFLTTIRLSYQRQRQLSAFFIVLPIVQTASTETLFFLKIILFFFRLKLSILIFVPIWEFYCLNILKSPRISASIFI